MTAIGKLADFEPESTTSIRVNNDDILLVRHGDNLFLYRNLCPHAMDTLDPLGTSVLAADGLLLHCQRHGAEFQTDTGLCVAGPCLGEKLQAIAFTLAEGVIYLD